MSEATDKRDKEVSGYMLEQFVQLSCVLTGFDKVELLGTGMAAEYYRAITRVYKEPVLRLLFEARAIIEVYGEESADFAAQIQQRIIQDIEFAQIAKNIIQLWYLGSYTNYNDPAPLIYKEAHIISPEAYQNGLLWQAANTHPAGARQPGYGSWQLPPRAELED
jgi:hypothetical protein